MKTGERWQLWQRTSRRGRCGRNSTFKYYSECLVPPRNVQRATVQHKDHQRVIMTGYSSSRDEPKVMATNSLTTKDLRLNILNDNLNINNFITALATGNIRAVSDGSFQPEEKIGAAAWVLEEGITETHTCGAMPVIGEKSLQNPCRSEVMGIYYLLLHIYKLCQDHNIHSGRMSIHCDGLSAIQSIQYQSSEIYTTGKNFDIINAIVNITHKLPLQITYEHIKGHQDRGSAYNSLSRLAQLNIMVDSLAKQEAKKIKASNHTYHHESIPYSICEVSIATKHFQTVKIGSNLTQTVRTLLTGDTSRDYWIKKNNAGNTFRHIDWELRQKSLGNISTSQQRWLCKFSTGFCGVGKMLQRYKWQNHTKCPRCLADNETTRHVLQCRGAGVATIWEEELTALDAWMLQNKVHSELKKLIIKGIEAWVYKTPITYSPSNQHLQRAQKLQDRIGWFPFLLGFWADSFFKCQQEYMQEQRHLKSPQLLLSKVQRRVWHIAWKLWEHRNKFLHETNHSYHPTEIIAISAKIEKEWKRNLEDIQREHSVFFSGTL